MVVETDDKEERTDETTEALSVDSELIGWLGAMHSEIRALRVEIRSEVSEVRAEIRESRDETRAEIRETRDETRAEIRETRDETRAEIREVRAEVRESRDETRAEIRELSTRTGRVEERVTRIEAGIEAERSWKNRLLTLIGVGVAVLFGVGGAVIGVIGLLN